MQPNSRLLIRFTLPNGDMKGWGYDEPYFKSMMQLQQSIIDDFKDEWPEHTDLHLFYHDSDKQITSEDAYNLAEQAGDFLHKNGARL